MRTLIFNKIKPIAKSDVGYYAKTIEERMVVFDLGIENLNDQMYYYTYLRVIEKMLIRRT